jgi:hypothetical protein
MRNVLKDYKGLEVETLHHSHLNLHSDSEESKRTRTFFLNCANQLKEGVYQHD